FYGRAGRRTLTAVNPVFDVNQPSDAFDMVRGARRRLPSRRADGALAQALVELAIFLYDCPCDLREVSLVRLRDRAVPQPDSRAAGEAAPATVRPVTGGPSSLRHARTGID